MQLLSVTLPTPQENLALDEALLDEADESDWATESMRLWEPAAPLVVVGSSSKVAAEANEKSCQERGMPILRRASGGAAVVCGPGCLIYSLILSYRLRPQLRAIDQAHGFVLTRIVEALRPFDATIERRGTSDLAAGDRKFSGNSIRAKRDNMLYHGTILYDFPLDLITECLRRPPREPEYRRGRDHRSFITNLDIDGDQIRRCLKQAWSAHRARVQWPAERVAELTARKYLKREWNYRR